MVSASNGVLHHPGRRYSLATLCPSKTCGIWFYVRHRAALPVNIISYLERPHNSEPHNDMSTPNSRDLFLLSLQVSIMRRSRYIKCRKYMAPCTSLTKTSDDYFDCRILTGRSDYAFIKPTKRYFVARPEVKICEHRRL